MELSVIKIGNSRGIRLSKTLLEKYDIKDTVEVILEQDHLIIRPKNIPRKDWDKAFRKMHEKNDDKPLMPDFFKDENLNEWI